MSVSSSAKGTGSVAVAYLISPSGIQRKGSAWYVAYIITKLLGGDCRKPLGRSVPKSVGSHWECMVTDFT